MEIWPKKNRNFSNSRWRTDAILKIVFWQYLSAILANLCKFRNGDEESQADIGHLTKVAIFANSRWRRATILKIALYPYLSRNYPISSKFGMPIQISILGWLFDKKIEIFQIQDGGRTPYWKSFWLYIRDLLANRREIRKGDEESHANTGHVTKTAIFQFSVFTSFL